MRLPAPFPMLMIGALSIATLAACDRDARESAPTETPRQMPPQTMTPQDLPAALAPVPAPLPIPGESNPPKVAIADQQGGAPREIAGKALLPLARILEIARRRVPGEVIEVDLDDDDDDDPPEYELEILTPDGRSIDMKIDARTGAILEVEED